MKERPLPACCRGCIYHDSDFREDYGIVQNFCLQNVWLPYRTQECKKRKGMKWTSEEAPRG